MWVDEGFFSEWWHGGLGAAEDLWFSRCWGSDENTRSGVVTEVFFGLLWIAIVFRLFLGHHDGLFALSLRGRCQIKHFLFVRVGVAQANRGETEHLASMSFPCNATTCTVVGLSSLSDVPINWLSFGDTVGLASFSRSCRRGIRRCGCSACALFERVNNLPNIWCGILVLRCRALDFDPNSLSLLFVD